MKEQAYYSFYNPVRFKYLHKDFLEMKNVKFSGNEIIKKTATFIGEDRNVYIDTSDGVNEDLEIQEYCGRIKKVINHSNGKPFVFLKSAYSQKWSKNITDEASKNNGTVLPFFKWSFNDNFYSKIYNRRESVIEKYYSPEKEYDIGIFFEEKDYLYPKPSSFDALISHSDHKAFGIEGFSEDTGYYANNSRQNLIKKLKDSDFKILHTSMPYEDYIKSSFNCKIIINPPGIGEYTSRMVDQTYLGNCIVMRKNSYDNAHSWKNYIPEVDFNSENWEKDLKNIIDNYEAHQLKCKEYFDKFWTSKSICEYLKKIINES